MKAHLVLRMDVITVLTMIVVSCLDGPAAANQTTEAAKQNGDSVETNIEGSVVNADGEPIAKAWVSCLGYAGDDANDFEPVYVRTDEQGRFQAGVPSGRFRVHINSPSDEYDDIDGFGVRNGAAICSWDGVVDRSTGEKISVLATLPRAYDLRFNLVDSKTGQTVPDAAILYKDDEAFWVEEFDYETWASWIVYRVFEDGLAIFKKETSATMRLAHIQILASGYKPVRLKLDEKLERGKRLVKQVRMQPLPVVELAVAAHGGGPAAGGGVREHSPRRVSGDLSRSRRQARAASAGYRCIAGRARSPAAAVSGFRRLGGLSCPARIRLRRLQNRRLAGCGRWRLDDTAANRARTVCNDPRHIPS